MGRLAARAAVAFSVLLALAALASFCLEPPLPPSTIGRLRLYKIRMERHQNHAARILRRAIAHPQTDSYPFLQLAELEKKSGHHERAERLLREAARRDDDGLDALADYAVAWNRLPMLESALADRPDNNARALARARLLVARGRAEEALALLRIVELSVEPGRAHLEIGRTLIALGRVEEGCDRVKRAAGLLERRAYPDAEACRRKES